MFLLVFLLFEVLKLKIYIPGQESSTSFNDVYVTSGFVYVNVSIFILLPFLYL